jgi:hypothetical protein
MKKNETLSFTDKWIELENRLSEVILVQKDNGCMFTLIRGR